MKCPSCNRDSAKYIQRTNDRGTYLDKHLNIHLNPRTDFRIKCSRCKVITDLGK